MRACPFCGFAGKLSREHVFGAWLSRIGLSRDPRPHGAGPVNRIKHELGVRPPFSQTVGVCSRCNNGWKSHLETVAQRVLTPFILGQPGQVELDDAAAIAAWVHKNHADRHARLIRCTTQRGLWAPSLGVPSALGDESCSAATAGEPVLDRPLHRTQSALGSAGDAHDGQCCRAARYRPPAGLRDDDRARAAGTAWCAVHDAQSAGRSAHSAGVASIVANGGPAEWPGGAPVDDAGFLDFAGGKDLRSTEQLIELRPWTPATELPQSRVVDGRIELPTACGQHFVYYPTHLVKEAMRGRFHAFSRACECGTAYLIETEPDGAHCKEAGTIKAIAELYERLPGDEVVITDRHGAFPCKRLPGRTDQPG
jgi:hypothetical protein